MWYIYIECLHICYVFVKYTLLLLYISAFLRTLQNATLYANIHISVYAIQLQIMYVLLVQILLPVYCNK